ncbi:Antirestriction protein ArdC [Fodinibius salinus]|uniref:Antirestriction protein ArdC n=1 Tax=Fodinibius salinus TaxID=860790 RepID=A0A5D3YFT3_9BACT|nr:zincin-like metallopeptidase domain-containing protein [Fodinibius salinus]TYP92085.1 Antirestriction protein ArdC [Fodinibius salinus]
MISTAELANTEFEGITLPDPYGDFLGEIPNDASMSIWGPPGSGKSTFAIALALILADKVGKGIYCSSEEGPGPSMKSKIKRLKAEHDNVLVSDYEGIERLKSAVEFSHSNFVVVDSISKSAITVAEFEEFLDWCKKQDVISIFILHTTKEGTYKGHTEFIHNPDIEIKVEDGLAKIDNKNRFQETPREMEVEFERDAADGRRQTADDSSRKNPEEDERYRNRVIIEHFQLDTYRDADFDYFKKWLKENYPDRKDEASEIWDTPKYGYDRPDPKADRENPTTAGSDLVGIPFIENPGKELRENRGVKPDEIYQMVTDMIINTIEDKGHLPWQMAWDDSSLSGGKTATNFVSGNAYRGINFFMLNFRQVINDDGELTLEMINFDNPYFLTFNQVDDLGGKVKEDSRGQKVIYFTKLYKIEQEDPEIDFGTYSLDEMIEFVKENYDDINRTGGRSPEQVAKSKYIPILKYYNVFHASDIEGIDWGELPKNENADKSTELKIKVAKAIYDHYPNAPEIKHTEPRAYYQPDMDFINMPPLDRFDEEQFYHTTLFHEAVHSTGHKSRLDRNLKGGKTKALYAKEELIAEMGAVYLCSESGILFKTLDNSAKYLQSWNKRLVGKMKDDNRFFFRAASRAQAAADHILDRNEDGVPAYRADVSLDNRENPTTDTQCLVSAKAQTNEEKNGIEIQFSDAPPKWVRDQLTDNGFTFYNPNDGESFWAAEKTSKRKQVIESIAGDLDQAVVKWKPKTDKQPDTTQPTSSEASAQEGENTETDNAQVKTDSVDVEVKHVLGNKTTVDFKADGSIQEQGRYAIVEAADLIPSHNKDCTPNSAHKISKGQPRDRSLDALCSQPKFIAQNLNPTSITRGNLAFNGAPTTLPDIQHIQGNGRGIALEIVYDEHPQNAKKYVNYLEDNAADWGFTKSEIEEFKQPVLIRILDVSKDRAIELGNVVDTSQAKMSKVDQGKAYIRNLPKDQKQVIGNLINNSSGETLGEVINDVGLRIMDQFEDLDRQGLVEENSLTSEGKDFLRSVFAGLVFDSDENKQALQHFMNLKHTQKAGLQRAYGNIIPFIDTDADLTPTIQKAVEITAQVQQKDGIDTVRDFMSQSDAFSGANKDEFSEQQAQLARFLLDADTQKAIRNGFRMYQYKINGKEDLFNPIEKVSPEKAFKDAFVERIRINPDGEQVKLQAVSEFDTGEIIRDFYDTDKYEVVGTKDDNYIIKNTRTGKKENIAPDVRRFVPDRSETPTMELFDDFRTNPKDPLVYIGFTERIHIDTGNGMKALKGEFPTFLSDNKLYIVPPDKVEQVSGVVEEQDAIEGFEEWHNYDADDTDFAIDWPEDAPAEPIGTASKIWYGSDKIMQEGDQEGMFNYYVHEFDAGKRPAVVKGDIMIVGNIDWNKRGLLN